VGIVAIHTIRHFAVFFMAVCAEKFGVFALVRLKLLDLWIVAGQTSGSLIAQLDLEGPVGIFVTVQAAGKLEVLFPFVTFTTFRNVGCGNGFVGGVAIGTRHLALVPGPGNNDVTGRAGVALCTVLIGEYRTVICRHEVNRCCHHAHEGNNKCDPGSLSHIDRTPFSLINDLKASLLCRHVGLDVNQNGLCFPIKGNKSQNDEPQITPGVIVP
jgi:hypothetical protein